VFTRRHGRQVTPDAESAVARPTEELPCYSLLTGDFPGDGRPKPVAFPDPRAVADPGHKYKVVSLATLVELKLASGMTAPHRLQDLADVLRLIHEAAIARDFASRLDPFVGAKFDQLWLLAQHPEEDY